MSQKEWLQQRSEFILNCAQDKLHHSFVEFGFDDPCSGWVKFHFKNYDGEEVEINTSNEHEPFRQIIKWLEYIISGESGLNSAAFTLDCDTAEYIFSYDSFHELYLDSLFTDFPGVFSIYKKYAGYVFKTQIHTLEFIKDFYGTLLEYAKKNSKKPEFIEEWISYFVPDLDKEKASKYFTEQIRSPFIEKRIKELERVRNYHLDRR